MPARTAHEHLHGERRDEKADDDQSNHGVGCGNLEFPSEIRPCRSPRSPSPPITVSIVSHGQLELVRPLLDQLDRFSRAMSAKVVLTINIPEPDRAGGRALGLSGRAHRERAPMGFGANHNQAFARCDTPWFLVLNPDIRFDADVLAPLVAQAAPDSRPAGAAHPRARQAGAGAAPRDHHAAGDRLAQARRTMRARRCRPGFRACSCCFAARPIAQIGGFDERFFMYGEDFDICARLRLAGWKLQIAEKLQARHDARRASHRSKRHLYWHLTSLLKVWSSAAFWRYRQLALRYRS